MTLQNLQVFEECIARLCPLDLKPGRYPKEAAVAILLTRDNGKEKPALVLTLRAEHLRHHAGEVAFPGGKWEIEDESLAVTALRETWEEIAQPPAGVDLIATLPKIYTRQGVAVTPYVGWIDSVTGLVANPDELDHIFTVPLEYLLQDPRVRTDSLRHGKQVWRVPVYEYQGFTIWGFTAAVIAEFLNLGFAADIDIDSSPFLE